MATETTEYISNPFKMVGPSANALGVNIGTLFALIALFFAPIIPFAIAAALGFAARGNAILIGIAATLGIASFAAVLVIALLSAPAFAIILLASVNNQKVSLKTSLVQAKSFVWRALAISILTALAVFGGLLLLVVPAFIFSAWFSLSIYALVKEDLSVTASMKRSRQLVKGRIFEIWSVSMLPTLAYIVPFLGGLLNFVLSIVLIPATAIRYQLLVATKSENRPAVHWSNYVLVIGSIVLLIVLVAVLIATAATGDNSADSFNSPSYFTY